MTAGYLAALRTLGAARQVQRQARTVGAFLEAGELVTAARSVCRLTAPEACRG